MSKQNLIYIAFAVLLILSWFHGKSKAKVVVAPSFTDTSSVYIGKLELLAKSYRDSSEFWKDYAIGMDSTAQTIFKLYKESREHERIDNYNDIPAHEFEAVLRSTMDKSRADRLK